MTLATRSIQTWLLLAAAAAAPCQRTPDEAISALQEGNRRFAADKSIAQPVGDGVRRTLARGQSPFAIVLCCADSRVPPEHIFNAGLGELFVVRIAGHTCDAETLASIEYAVDHLNTPLCVVLGHESCGAVAAGLSHVEGKAGDGLSPAIRQLLEQIEPAVRKAKARDLGGKALSDACEEEHVHTTIGECMHRSALLRRFASVGKFRMVPARYHLQSGEVEWLPNRPQPAEQEASPAGNHGAPMGVPPHVALRMLQAGHRRYLGDGQSTADLTAHRREQLTHGQHPLAIVVTCADSRVAPEHVFDAGLGELFVIRVAGNTLNDDTLASIEYAAAHTGASLLVVMGHTACGAVQAAAQSPEGTDLTPSLRALLTRLEPSVAKARATASKGSDLVDLAVRANALRTLAEARSRSALLRDLEAQGRFAMLPAVYDTASGDVNWLKEAPEGTDAEAAPAPHGETAPRTRNAPGGDSHGGHGTSKAPVHGQAAHGTAPADDRGAKHGHDAHAGAHAAPNAGHQPTNGHGATGNHGGDHGSAHDAGNAHDAGDAHGTDTGHAAATEHAPTHSDSHGSGHGDSHHGDAASAHSPAPPSGASTKWLDPTLLASIAGVTSLVLAALLVMKKRT